MAIEEFRPKKFTSAHKQLIRQANAIIEEYTKLGYKLTLRQIHYQFVARDWYENTFANYKRLGNVLNAARMAGMVDWDSFDDPTRTLKRLPVYNRPEDAIQRIADTFKLDPWDEQPIKRRIEIWTEKDAATSIVRPTCNDLRLAFFSCRGYSSSSGLYEAAKRLRSYKDAGYETLVLYLGDHDPSGVQMTDSTLEKVCLFAGCDIEVRRIALTMAQVEEFNPPANFAKETDSRTKWYVDKFGTEDCWELDALKPQTVDALIRSHVEPLIDRVAWEQTMKAERAHLATLAAIMENWERTKAAPDMLAYIQSVSSQPVESEQFPDGSYENVDSATLGMVIDEADEVLTRHGLL